MKMADRNLLLKEASRLLRAGEPLSDAMREWLADGLAAEAEGRPWPHITGRCTKKPVYVVLRDLLDELDRRGVKDPDGEDKAEWIWAVKTVAGRHGLSERTVEKSMDALLDMYSELGIELQLELVSLQADTYSKKE